MLEYTLGQAHGKDVVILLMHEGKSQNAAHSAGAGSLFPRGRATSSARLSTGEEDRGILSRCGAHFMLPDAAQDKEAIDDMRCGCPQCGTYMIQSEGIELRLRLPGMPVPLPGVHGHEYRRQPRRTCVT